MAHMFIGLALGVALSRGEWAMAALLVIALGLYFKERWGG